MEDLLMKELNSVFQEVFNNPKLIIRKDMDPDSIRSWDSLAQLELIAAIEQKFDVNFDFSEMLDLINVRTILKILGTKLDKKNSK